MHLNARWGFEHEAVTLDRAIELNVGELDQPERMVVENRDRP